MFQNYKRILTKKTLGLFFVSWIFRYLFRVNSSTSLVVHYSNRIVGSTDLELTGDGDGLLLSLLSNVGIYISTSNNGVVVDRSVYIASGAKIISANHDFKDLSAPGVHDRAVVIGKDCWLGANSVILPAVVLGPRTVVAAGAVVTKSYPEGGAVLAGVPAKVLRVL